MNPVQGNGEQWKGKWRQASSIERTYSTIKIMLTSNVHTNDKLIMSPAFVCCHNWTCVSGWMPFLLKQYYYYYNGRKSEVLRFHISKRGRQPDTQIWSTPFSPLWLVSRIYWNVRSKSSMGTKLSLLSLWLGTSASVLLLRFRSWHNEICSLSSLWRRLNWSPEWLEGELCARNSRT